MGQPQLVPVTKADKDEFLHYFIELLDRGVNDEYYFTEGQARVLGLLGLEPPANIILYTNGVRTHTIKFITNEEEE